MPNVAHKAKQPKDPGYLLEPLSPNATTPSEATDSPDYDESLREQLRKDMVFLNLGSTPSPQPPAPPPRKHSTPPCVVRYAQKNFLSISFYTTRSPDRQRFIWYKLEETIWHARKQLRCADRQVHRQSGKPNPR
ncbi:hypothetical protein V491_01617 [Pseudogymnoascus sp. VKM F-3775]|nr:hypothetical protein V491_01617 [Pseudogymnoascus sp. VKM F-3775]